MLSDRIKNILSKGSATMQGHMLCTSDPFHSENPQGYLNFGIAENHLMENWMLNYVNQVNPVSAEELQYFNLSGTQELRQSCKQFFARQFKLTDLDPTKFVIMNGLSSVCECLSFSLFSKGDYLMIPTPYYSGFEFDFQKRFGVEFLKVPLTPENGFVHTIEPFIKAYDNFSDKSKIKAVLITHPHNPTGEILNEDFLREIIDFAKARNLEIVSDEIYALTSFDNQPHKSLLSFADGYEQHIHLLYGLAKDFTLAGLKVGIFYSENIELVQAMNVLTYFHCTSSLTQSFTSRLLSDENFVSKFLIENNSRLKKTKNKLLQSLPEMEVYDGGSGLFFLCDFRKYLPAKSFAGEDELNKKLLNEYKIFLTSGVHLGVAEPGYFRLCFAKRDAEVDELILRLKKFFETAPTTDV